MRHFFNAIAKPVVVLVLRSPVHVLLSRHLLLLTVTGRKSGKRYTFPVGYVLDGDRLRVVSRPDHGWWRNLAGEAPVDVLLRGKKRRGIGTILTLPESNHALRQIDVQIQLV